MLNKLSKLLGRNRQTKKVGGSTQTPAADSEHSSYPQSTSNTWHTEDVAGRTVEIFTPSTSSAPEACVIFLHGHGRIMLSENETYTSLFQSHNLCAVCPDGGQSWWLDRVSTDFDNATSPQDWILENLLPFIESRWSINPPSIALLGVSMGGQGALQLSYRHANKFPVVAAISPAVDFHQLYGSGLPLDEMFENAEDARQATVVLNLHPLAWPRHQWFCCDPNDADWFDGCARLGMKLSSSGVLHERDLATSAGGHSWEYFNHVAPQAVGHIAKCLKQC